ncbi:hypothetical protein ACQ4PT_059124 [Festuca glaucescens]
MKHHSHTTRVSDGKLRVSVDNMPPASFKALLHFAYTDSLPVVSGFSGAGHKEMLRCLLIAAQRYGMERLKAICERVLSKSIDVDTVAATLAMAEKHGFNQATVPQQSYTKFHKEMPRCLLIAAQRYGMKRLKAICERVLSKSIDVDTVAATLAMASAS